MCFSAYIPSIHFCVRVCIYREIYIHITLKKDIYIYFFFLKKSVAYSRSLHVIFANAFSHFRLVARSISPIYSICPRGQRFDRYYCRYENHPRQLDIRGEERRGEGASLGVPATVYIDG